MTSQDARLKNDGLFSEIYITVHCQHYQNVTSPIIFDYLLTAHDLKFAKTKSSC
jgi:hypothetical protein